MDNYSRIQYQEKSNKAHRRLIYVGLMIFVLLSVTLYLFVVLLPINSTASKFSSLAETKAGIKKVKTFKESDRNGSYYSIYGTNSKGKEYLVIFNAKEKIVDKVPTSKQVSDSKLDKIYEKYKIKNVYSFAPSIYKGRAVFELSYEGKKNSVNFLTVDLKSGKVYRLIEGL
ncbi:hypothetical protein FCS83_02555 [Oenococcus sp. UCMA 17063]|nr:hypothetical protein [Oenococcus sp. UCMA 17063]